MSVEDVLSELEQLGVRLWCEGAKLKFRAPSGALSEGLLAKMNGQRAELFRALGRSRLSSAQYALWLHEQWDPGTPAYNIGFAMEVRGELSEQVLRAALSAVIQRHPTLRSVLVKDDDGPATVVRARVDADLRTRSVPSTDDVSPNFLRAALEEPFDLTQDVPLRAYWFHAQDGRRWLLLVAHHFAVDATSFWQIFGELESALRGVVLPRSESASYAAAARSEARFLAGPQRASVLAKYRARIQGYSTLLELPNDFPYPKSYMVRGASIEHHLDGKATRIRELAKRLRATPYALLMAVFGVWIHRLTGQERFLVGSPMSGRSDAAYAGTVGHFVNVLPIRMNLADNPGFDEVVVETRQELLTAMADQAIPIGVLAADLDVERHPSRSALLQVVFGWQNPPLAEIAAEDGVWSPFGGTHVRAVRVPQQEGAFELIVDATETPAGMSLTFKYNTSIFTEASVRHYIESFDCILEAALRDPEAPVNELTWVSREQLRVVVDEFRGETLELTYQDVVTAIQRAFVMHSERLAIKSGERELTYGQLDLLSGGVARELNARSVGPGHVVGLVLEPGVEMAVAALGVLRAGAAYLPIDPSYPSSRITHQLTDSGARNVICCGAFAAANPGLFTGGMELLRCEDIRPAACPAMPIAPDSAAYVVYTSGSTGRPKGVLVEHRALANLCAWHCRAFSVCKDDRATKYAGWGFDASVWEMFPYLTVGASLHVVPEECRLEMDALERFFESSAATIAFLPTPICERFLKQPNRSLRLLLTGGDTLHSVEHRGRYDLVNNYGPTECCVVATSGHARRGLSRNVMIGRPVSNTRAYVLSGDNSVCPVGIFGELCLAGLGVARGYHGNVAETAQRFRTNLVPEERVYRTGDRVRWLASGELEFQGRTDRQVKVRGVRVELGEVEHVLSEFEGVQKVVAVLANGANSQLVAYYEGDPSRCSPNALAVYSREHLPPAAVPAHFIAMARLPTTANGKIDLRALPAPSRKGEGAIDEATFSDLEMQVANLWKEYLHLEHLQYSDGFFELGGNSLLAAKLAAEVGRHFGAEVPVKALVDASDFRAFCAVVRTAMSGKALCERKVTPDELWKDSKLADALSPESSVHGPQRKIIVTGATGFVGSFLLAQLLEDPALNVTCLVRALGPAEARERLRIALRTYGIDGALMRRVDVVAADFTKERLGLDLATYEQLATDHGQIFHCGAAVNFTYSYFALREANVMGTLRMLQLACTGPLKKVHLISAGSVVEAASTALGQAVREDDPLDAPERLTMGYSQTKWVGERLARSLFSRGVQGTIHRLGLIWGHTGTGVCNLDDLAMRCVLTSLDVGSVPAWQHDLHFTTVDFSVRAIVALSSAFSQGEAFHLTPPHPLSDDEQFEILRELRPELKQEPYAKWRERVLQVIDETVDHPLAAVRHYFTEDLRNFPLRFDTARATAFLDPLGLTHPALTSAAVRKYAQYFAENGLFPFVLESDQPASSQLALVN